MNIDLTVLNYTFKQKPLLVGGKAMEYYGLRKAGADIDFIVAGEDHKQLRALFPDSVVNLFGDIGVKIHSFEIWTCIRLLDYSYYSQNAIDEGNYLVMSLDKLFLLKGLAALDKKLEKNQHEKYMKDLEMLSDKIQNIQYGKDNSIPKL